MGVLAARRITAMYCPACRSEYPDDWRRCPKDEAELLKSQYIGKYRVDSVIGAGGMGAVYRAYNPDTRSPVAIKLMHAEASSVEASRTRFQREAASVAALQTRHLVNIYDFGSEDDGTLYLVMEFLQGHDLRPEIAEGDGGMPIPRVNLILGGALRGLGAAHKKGIIHRDLKPENIYIADTEDGEVAKVLDFGIAQVQSSKDESVLTKEGALMGTPAYMAPEQVAGNRGELGPWTDVYSMGVILYEMLTGKAPFADESVTAVLSKVLTRDFVPLRELRPDLPEPVLALVDCAMEDSYANRFADANAFRDAWEAAHRAFDPAIQTATVPTFVRTRDVATAESSPGIDPMQPTEYPDEEDLGTAPTFLSPADGVPAPVTNAPREGVVAPTSGPVSDSLVREPRASRLPLLFGVVLVLAAAAVAFVLLRGGPPKRGGSAGHTADASTGKQVTGVERPSSADAAAAEPPRIPGDMVRVTGGPNGAFLIDKNEMTLGQFRAVRGDEALPGDQTFLPARNVTWHEAKSVCEKLGKRLPTEAEWEAAATAHPLDPAGARLHGPGVDGPSKVGTHPSDCTPDGICDLLGNVSEWTADLWSPDEAEASNPQRAIRGGSYAVSPKSAYARPESRTKLRADARDQEVGFRCARDVED